MIENREAANRISNVNSFIHEENSRSLSAVLGRVCLFVRLRSLSLDLLALLRSSNVISNVLIVFKGMVSQSAAVIASVSHKHQNKETAATK